MLAATRRASRSARCTSRPMNSGASSWRNSASTPEVRPLPWRSGQARMRYGIATCPACVAILLMTSGSRRVCVMASSCFCVRVRMVAIAGLRPGERESLVRHHDAGEHALEMSGGVGEQTIADRRSREACGWLPVTDSSSSRSLSRAVSDSLSLSMSARASRSRRSSSSAGLRWSCTYENGSTCASFVRRLQTTATTAASAPRSSRSQNR